MTEEFIRIHKPAVFRQQQVEPITPKRSKSKSRKSVGAKREKIEQGPKCDALENMFNLFEDRISETKKAIHKDLFESIYENTLQYFSFYESKRELFASSSLGLNPICNVIPTVALYTGINVQDYSYLCDKLSGSLRDNFTEYLFFVNEKNASNIKTLVNSIYMQWENLTDEEEKSKLPKKNMFSFRVFFDSIKAENKKPVIFFFKQFELIPKETIENFVSLISCYVENVSIYFILELASQSNIINQQLSSGVISKLCIKKLYLMSPSQYIDRFITQLFIDGNLLFKVSGDILKYLVDIYNDYNFSISGLTHALKYCYYDHLQANSLNAYMLSDELESFETHEMVLKQVMGSENRANQELFNKLTEPLFGTHPISINLRKVQNQVKQYSSEFLLVSMLLFEIVKQFPASAASGENDQDSVVFSSSSAHTFSDFFVRIWCFSSSSATSNKPFCELDEFGNLKRLLHLTSSNTLVGMIDAMMSLIQKKAMENEASYDVEFLNDVFTFHNDVLEVMKTKLAALGNSNLKKSFNEEEDEDISELRSLSKGTESLEATAASAAKVRRTKSLVTRRPSLRSTAAPSTLKPISENYSPTKKLKASTTNTKQQREDKQKLSKEIDSLKSSMISWLSEKFSHYFNFATYKAQPFMSHYCYSNLERLKTALFDVPRLNIHACLLNSFAYLNSNESSSSSYSCSPNKRPKLTLLNREPDILGLLPINVIYRVYLECGHMINLFDWLQAFVDKMENVGIDELDAAKKKTLIALFFRSITELQFMGFIKPTSRKVDHVVKLTNGSNLLALE